MKKERSPEAFKAIWWEQVKRKKLVKRISNCGAATFGITWMHQNNFQLSIYISQNSFIRTKNSNSLTDSSDV